MSHDPAEYFMSINTNQTIEQPPTGVVSSGDWFASLYDH